MIKKKLAVVDEQSGVTRDRNLSQCEWRRRTFYLVDTGGMVRGAGYDEQLILEQAQIAMDEADVVLFWCRLPDRRDRHRRPHCSTAAPHQQAGFSRGQQVRQRPLRPQGNAFYSLGIEKLIGVGDKRPGNRRHVDEIVTAA